MTNDDSPIDEQHFKQMVAVTPQPLASVAAVPEDVFVEQAVPDEGYFKGAYAVVWCYYAKGKPRKYTGRFLAIDACIRRENRPCLASICIGKSRKGKEECRWLFYNVDGLAVFSLSRWSSLPGTQRLGTNDHFAITHRMNGSVVKVKHYRRLPQAFPRDFLYAALGEMPTRDPAKTYTPEQVVALVQKALNTGGM